MRTLLPVAAAALTLFAGHALAESYATSGTTYFAQTAEPFALPTGEKVVQFTWSGLHMADNPAYPSDGAAQDCAGTLWIAADGGTTVRGACTLTDKDGDVEALTFEGTRETGAFTVTGGTGKYQGATGSGSYGPITMVGDDRGFLIWSAELETR